MCSYTLCANESISSTLLVLFQFVFFLLLLLSFCLLLRSHFKWFGIFLASSKFVAFLMFNSVQTHTQMLSLSLARYQRWALSFRATFCRSKMHIAFARSRTTPRFDFLSSIRAGTKRRRIRMYTDIKTFK